METDERPVSHVCADLRPGERMTFGATGVSIEVLAKSGRMTRLRLTLPKDVRVQRERAVPSMA